GRGGGRDQRRGRRPPRRLRHRAAARPPRRPGAVGRDGPRRRRRRYPRRRRPPRRARRPCRAGADVTRYHLIGIGGAGMAPVAELLAARGLEVSGSDARPSAILDRLRAAGVRAHVGHDPAHVPQHGTVVVSTAVRPDNPELLRARELGLPVIHRSQALVVAAGDQDFVAVAGAHGKTTTSAMLAVALAEVGADPSWAIGGSVAGLGGGAHLGQGRAFVAEADESDGSFLNYRPAVGVVTNVEPDHLDHYGSRDAFEQAFVDFAARVTGLLVVAADDESGGCFLNYRPAFGGVTIVQPEHLDHYGSRDAFGQALVDFAARVTGLLVVCADDAGGRRLVDRVGPDVRVLTYGTGPG